MNRIIQSSLPYLTPEAEAKFYAGELYILYDGTSEIKEFMEALHELGYRYINGRSHIELLPYFDDGRFYAFRFISERKAIKGYYIGDYMECPELPTPIPFFFVRHDFYPDSIVNTRFA